MKTWSYTLASTPVPHSHVDPDLDTDTCRVRDLEQCQCDVPCAVCGRPLHKQKLEWRTADRQSAHAHAHRTYRVDKTSRVYAHAQCVDDSWHWIMAATLARTVSNITTDTWDLNWGPGERVRRLTWASAAIMGLRAVTDDPDRFILGDGDLRGFHDRATANAPRLAQGMRGILLHKVSGRWPDHADDGFVRQAEAAIRGMQSLSRARVAPSHLISTGQEIHA